MPELTEAQAAVLGALVAGSHIVRTSLIRTSGWLVPTGDGRAERIHPRTLQVLLEREYLAEIVEEEWHRDMGISEEGKAALERHMSAGASEKGD